MKENAAVYGIYFLYREYRQTAFRLQVTTGGDFLEYIMMQEVWDQIEAIPGYARKKSSLLKVREFLGLLGEPDREFQ